LTPTLIKYNTIMTGGVGFSSNMTTSLKNNKKLRNRNHSFRRHEMNLPNTENKEKPVNLKPNTKHDSLPPEKTGIYTKKALLFYL